MRTLEDFLLDDMYYQKGIYTELLFDSNERLERLRKEAKENSYKPTTGEMVENDIKKMLEINLSPKVLSYELYQERRNPYKDIVRVKDIFN